MTNNSCSSDVQELDLPLMLKQAGMIADFARCYSRMLELEARLPCPRIDSLISPNSFAIVVGLRHTMDQLFGIINNPTNSFPSATIVNVIGEVCSAHQGLVAQQQKYYERKTAAHHHAGLN